MARKQPRIGTVLKPYDGMRRYTATVAGYAKDGRVKLRHRTGRRTVASMRHLMRTYRTWS